MTMEMQLSATEALELAALLDGTIADLSPEIADTDNPGYRAMLRARRDTLSSVRTKLNGTDALDGIL